MIDVDYKPLLKIIKESEKKNAADSQDCITKFDEAIANLKEKAYSLNQDEIAMLTISVDNWAKRRDYTKCNKYVFKVGDIFYADLGNAYKPEFAYLHPVVILGKIGFYLLVIPSSTSDSNIKNAYHPIDNPTGNKFMRKVYNCDGFERTSALLLSNIKTISQGRLIKPVGKIPLDLLDEIKQTIFKETFPKQQIKILQLEAKIKELENILIYKNTD